MLTIFLSALETEDERLSFEEIYNDNKNILYNCAYSILRDEPSAEDAVQDAFVSLARNFEKTKQMERNQIRGYMIIIVRNAAFKLYNKRKREVAAEDIYADEADTSDMTLDVENKELARTLFEMIKKLDSKYGDVIMLKYYHDMHDKDIADSLGLTVENVKVRLHRGRNALKKMLKEGGYCD